MSRKAVIVGATGLVGGKLLKLLLGDSLYSQITVFSRRPLDLEHEKLTTIVGDLLNDDILESNNVQVDDMFCCVGTTQSKTPDLAVYRNIDYGIPVRFADFGLQSGMSKFLVLSSLGANPDSKIFYSKIKGQMEETLKKKDIPSLHIFRPSLIMGKRDESRPMEYLSKVLMKVFRPLVPARYRGVEADAIALSMLKTAKSDTAHELIDSEEIRRQGAEAL